jgi:serine/threonine protein kinase
MKSMNKEFIVRDDTLRQTLIERMVVISARHPFIVRGHWAFQTERDVHMVMDYMPGGSLLDLIEQRRFTPDEARLYIGQIMLAIGYLHGEGILHRDIKPENILIDANGYIGLCDFGTVRIGLQGQTFAGTAYYQSPEMVRGQPYDTRSDWWSVGILLYEMVMGTPPYFAPAGQTMEVYKRIISAEPVDLSVILDNGLRGLLGRLLQKDMDLRIGNFNEVSEDPFFEGFDWAGLMSKQIPMPFVPEIASPITGGMVYDGANEQAHGGIHVDDFTLAESTPFPGRSNWHS